MLQSWIGRMVVVVIIILGSRYFQLTGVPSLPRNQLINKENDISLILFEPESLFGCLTPRQSSH